MNWLAILMALASLGGSPAPGKVQSKKPTCSAKVRTHCVKPKPKKKPTAKVKPRTAPTANQPAGTSPDTPAKTPSARPADPDATPTPTPTPAATPKPGGSTTPTPTPTPTATPVYPRRTAVDLVEWDVRSSYHTLAAGRVTFNVNNLGEDDHNLSVRSSAGNAGRIDLAPGETGPLVLDLPSGDYTLFCSLVGHEEAGMKLAVKIR